MSEARIEIKTTKICQLVDDYRSGRLVIPEFQREYVWKPSKAPKLIDSIYRGYPISVLLLWTSEFETRARRSNPRPSRTNAVSWLIDGQQRVITLSKIIGDEGIEVVFNPDTDEFKLSNAAIKRDPNWVRVVDILEDSTYRQIRKSLPDGKKGEARENKYDKIRKILDYEVPAVHMRDHTFNEAVEAFTRINTLGVKLKLEDIESARVAAKHSGFIADEVSPFLSNLKRQGFTRLTVMHLFRACAFVAIPDGRTRTPLHELDKKDVMRAWTKTKLATEEAIALIRNEFGLLNMDILWSGALLVPVIALCASTSPRERDSKGIAGWLAMAALHHRYSGASESALDQDLRACRLDDPIGMLLRNVRKDVGVFGAVAQDFKGGLIDKGAMFALYVSCRHRGLLDIFTGSKIVLQSNIDRHHILPKAQFSEKHKTTADTLANIAFVSGSANKSIGAAAPEVYVKEISPAVIRSQCLPSEEELWRIDRAEEFWAERRKLLAEAFNDYLKTMLPNRRIDA